MTFDESPTAPSFRSSVRKHAGSCRIGVTVVCFLLSPTLTSLARSQVDLMMVALGVGRFCPSKS
jgi:hypothetical protein